MSESASIAAVVESDNTLSTLSAALPAVIIGAGPAGLTAALELLERTAIVPVVLEQSEYMGGISRTINYKGNRIDIGGHRFFSKSDRVVEWWKTYSAGRRGRGGQSRPWLTITGSARSDGKGGPRGETRIA